MQNLANDAKIKVVQPPPSPFRGEKSGKRFSSWNLGAKYWKTRPESLLLIRKPFAAKIVFNQSDNPKLCGIIDSIALQGGGNENPPFIPLDYCRDAHCPDRRILWAAADLARGRTAKRSIHRASTPYRNTGHTHNGTHH